MIDIINANHFESFNVKISNTVIVLIDKNVSGFFLYRTSFELTYQDSSVSGKEALDEQFSRTQSPTE